MERAKERVSWLLKIEDRPFSLSIHYLIDYRDKFLAYYKAGRDQDRGGRLMSAIQSYSASPHGFSNQTGIGRVLTGLSEAGIQGVRAEDLAKLIPPDGMEPAFVIMADVRAYFEGMLYKFNPKLLLTSVFSGIQTLRR
jgi:hypothetical protein